MGVNVSRGDHFIVISFTPEGGDYIMPNFEKIRSIEFIPSSISDSIVFDEINKNNSITENVIHLGAGSYEGMILSKTLEYNSIKLRLLWSKQNIDDPTKIRIIISLFR